MSRTLRVHFLVPAPSAPAAHMTSGPPRDTPVGVLGTARPHVAACDPKIVLSEWDNGTGEAYAVQCKACAATDVHKAALAANPHPRLAGRPTEASPEDAGCCG